MEDLLSLQAILLLFLFLLSSHSLYLLSFGSNPKTPATTAPHGLRSYPLLGHLPEYIKNRHCFLDWITDALAATPTGTLTFRRLGGDPGIMTADPANLDHVLRSRFQNYPKGHDFRSLLEDFFGSGIINADGDLWRVQRKTASFEFNTSSFRGFFVDNVRYEALSRLLPLLKKASGDARPVDLQDVLERFGFDTICMVAFGVDPACLAVGDKDGRGVGMLASGFSHAFRDATDLTSARFRYAVEGFWKVKRLLGVGSERRLKESIATVHDFALRIIRSRKKEMQSSSSSPSPRAEDLLSRFMANEENSEEFLRDIVISFILAGQETTSSALTWFFWLLSSRPEVERRILEEIRRVRDRSSLVAGGGEGFSFEELREMHYIHAAISEAMRLFPPVPVNTVVCREDDVLPDGTRVKKGWFMSYIAYAMGRMEGVWGADCLEYRPERWLDGGGKFRPESPFKFPAFHGGPRMCLGKEMAYIQMKSIVAGVLERFEVDVMGTKDGAPPEQLLSFTLRMKGGLPVRVKERRAA